MKKVLKEAIDTALQEDTQLIIEATLVDEISVEHNLDNQVIILPITEIISETIFLTLCKIQRQITRNYSA